MTQLLVPPSEFRVASYRLTYAFLIPEAARSEADPKVSAQESCRIFLRLTLPADLCPFDIC